MSSAICSGSAEQPANDSKDSSAEHVCSAVQPGKPPPKGKRQGITNRTITKEEYRRQPANNSKDSSAEHMCSAVQPGNCLLYTSPSPRDKRQSRMPSSA